MRSLPFAILSLMVQIKSKLEIKTSRQKIVDVYDINQICLIKKASKLAWN